MSLKKWHQLYAQLYQSFHQLQHNRPWFASILYQAKFQRNLLACNTKTVTSRIYLYLMQFGLGAAESFDSGDGDSVQ